MDSSSSLEDECEETANLCLMAKEESKVSDSNYFLDSRENGDENGSTFRILCEKLLIELEKSKEKYKALEK